MRQQRTDVATAPSRAEARLSATSDAVGQAYFPHRLTPLSRDGVASSVLEVADLGPVKLVKIGWGADVAIRTEHPGAYAVNVPLSGRLDTTIEHTDITSTRGYATLCPPDTPTRITYWSGECTVLGVRLDAEAVAKEAARVLARPGGRLSGQLDLGSQDGAAWFGLARTVAQQVHDNPGLLGHPLVGPQLSGALISSLILAATPDEELPGPSRPWTVKVVLDAIHDDPGRPWTVVDMAALAGVSVRRLQQTFRDHVECSPMESLTSVRLDRVRKDLLSAPAGTTVTDVAWRWGFTHTGRFAGVYARRYGESPSRTLARR